MTWYTGTNEEELISLPTIQVDDDAALEDQTDSEAESVGAASRPRPENALSRTACILTFSECPEPINLNLPKRKAHYKKRNARRRAAAEEKGEKYRNRRNKKQRKRIRKFRAMNAARKEAKKEAKEAKRREAEQALGGEAGDEAGTEAGAGPVTEAE